MLRRLPAPRQALRGKGWSAMRARFVPGELEMLWAHGGQSDVWFLQVTKNDFKQMERQSGARFYPVILGMMNLIRFIALVEKWLLLPEA